MTALRITDHSTRAQIADAIAALRAKAVRYSVRDPKRAAIDAEVDGLVDQWLEADA